MLAAAIAVGAVHNKQEEDVVESEILEAVRMNLLCPLNQPYGASLKVMM